MKMKNTVKKVLSVFGISVLIAAITLTFCCCKDNTNLKNGKDVSAVSTADPVQNLGEGATVFYLTVRDTVDPVPGQTFKIKTDEKTVGEALQKLDLIRGEAGQFGLYVKQVNGITADFEKDGSYWAFYKNGSYAEKGVDQTPVVPEGRYELVREKG